jgi:hypothetical protein
MNGPEEPKPSRNSFPGTAGHGIWNLGGVIWTKAVSGNSMKKLPWRINNLMKERKTLPDHNTIGLIPMSKITYLGLLCLGCLILGAAAASAACDSAASPAFCNKVETGSSMILTTGSLSSSLGDRFIMGSAGSGVELFSNVDVSSYAPDLPSKGSVSAYLKGTIMEAGRNATEISQLPTESAKDLYEFASFFDSTSISGDIFSFSKQMSYSSMWG